MHELMGFLRGLAAVIIGMFGLFQLSLAVWTLADRDFSLLKWAPALCVFLGLASFSGWAAYRLVRGNPRRQVTS